MNRLPDYALEVLTNAAAEGTVNARASHAGTPAWDELTPGQKNGVRESALPFIFHGTKALATLGYRKPRTITTIEEVDSLPAGSVVSTVYGDASTIHAHLRGKGSIGYKFLIKYGPATVLREGYPS